MEYLVQAANQMYTALPGLQQMMQPPSIDPLSLLVLCNNELYPVHEETEHILHWMMASHSKAVQKNRRKKSNQLCLQTGYFQILKSFVTELFDLWQSY